MSHYNTIIVLLLLLIIIEFYSVIAFPNGAGGCDSPVAVSAIHIDQSNGREVSFRSEVNVFANNIQLQDFDPNIVQPGQLIQFNIQSVTGNLYRGFLFRIEKISGNGIIESTVFTPTDTQSASTCIAPIIGFTHIDRELKNDIIISIRFIDEAIYRLDVNLVFENTVTRSQYAYDTFFLNVQNDVGTFLPCQSKLIDVGNGDILILDECLKKQFNIPGKGDRNVTVYYTINNGNDADQLDSLIEASNIIDWIEYAWKNMTEFNDPYNNLITDFEVVVYEIPALTNCCRDNILSVDASTLISNPNYTRERIVYEFWKSINFSETHGQWVNDGFAVYGAYRLLVPEVFDTTQDFNAALDLYFAGEYQQSLTIQESNAALFWLYFEEQTFLLSSGLSDNVPDIWSDSLSGQDIFDRVESYVIIPFESFYADFGAACYVNGLDSIDISLSLIATKLRFLDSTRLINSGLSSYPTISPNLTFNIASSSDSTSGIAEMVSWSNFYLRLTLPTTGTNIPGYVQIRVLQDYSYPVIYSLLLIDDSNILVGYVRRENARNFFQTVTNDNISEIVLVVTCLGEPISFEYTVTAEDPFLSIESPRSLTAVGDATSPNQFTLNFKVSDSVGGNEIAGLTPADVVITIGSVVVPATDIITFSFLQGEYSLLVKAPVQDISVTGTALDLSVTVKSLTDNKVDVILYEERTNSDTILVIDRSQSMNQNGKLQAVQAAASVLIDSYSDGDQVGVVTYNDSATVQATLTEFSVNRDASLLAIDNIVASGADAVIGNALLTSLSELDARGDYNHASSFVVISDGPSPASDTDIDAFLTEWDERSLRPCTSTDKSGCRPAVHTINIGERGIDRPDLERLSERTGGVYHFIETPGSSSGIRLLQQNDLSFGVELASLLRSVNEDILNTDKLFSETGSLPCLDLGDSDAVVQIDVDGSVSNLFFFFIWTGDSLVPGVQLLDPNGVSIGDPDSTSTNHYVWAVESVAAGTWTLIVSVSNLFCAADNFFLVEAAVTSGIFFETSLSYEGDLPEVGVPVEVSAILTAGGEPLAGQSVSATVVFPNGITQELALSYEANGIYAKTITPTLRGNYEITVSASGSEIVVGDGNYGRTDDASFGVPIATDSDGDGMPDALERRYKCLDIARDDADEDADGDDIDNFEELALNLDPCNSNTDNGGEADGSEIITGRDPTDPDDDVSTCSQDLEADNKAFDREGTGTCDGEDGEKFAILRYSPDKNWAFINVFRAELPPGGNSRNLRTRDFTLLNLQRDASFFTNVNGEFFDTIVEVGKKYCYRFQGVNADGAKSCVKGTIRPACTTVLSASLCVRRVQLNRGACCTFNPQVALSVDASGAQRMKVSNLPSFEGVDWEPYATSRVWTINDQIIEEPQTVYTIFEGDDGTTVSRSASITYFEAPPSAMPSLAPSELPSIAPSSLQPTEAPVSYGCSAFIISGLTMHINFFGLFCVEWCLPSFFQYLGWGLGGCP